MELGVWTFVRGAETLELKRQDLDDGTVLAIAGDGEPRSYFFRDVDRLETFQKDMETLLLKTGWTFVSYTPDRSRRSNDRRRWWTDGSRTKRTKAAASGIGRKPAPDEERPRRSEK